jgi:hypothetical protein
LNLAPARPLVVRPDGTIEVDGQLLRELGLEQPCEQLDDHAGSDRGIAADDLAPLKSDNRRGRLPRVGSFARCAPAAPAARSKFAADLLQPPSCRHPLAVVLRHHRRGGGPIPKLAQRLRQTEGALASLTRLIEAAPFPMWYRGPDLRLGLVNSAFVEAVEGRDAGDVIARGSELIDAVGESSPLASARAAQETASRCRGCIPQSLAASAGC